MSKRTLRFSTEARWQYREILQRVARKWGQASALKLDSKFDAAAKQLIDFPETAQVSDTHSDMRRCVVTPQTSFLYHVTNSEIVITAVFDNRQNPTALLPD